MKNISQSDYLKSQAEKINKLFLSGKFDLVIEKSKKILEKNPKQVPFYNFLALSHREKGNFLLAEKILLNALKLFPIEQSLLINLGSTYRVLMKFEKSEKCFKQVLEINSNNINDYCIEGVDGISIGALTHNIKSIDIGLDLK